MFRTGQWIVYKGRVGIHLGSQRAGTVVGEVLKEDGSPAEKVVAPLMSCEVHLIDKDGMTEDVLFLEPAAMAEVRTAYLQEIPDARRETSDEGILAARYPSKAV